MIRQLFKIILFLTASVTIAQSIKSIDITDDGVFPKEDILEYVSIAEGGKYSLGLEDSLQVRAVKFFNENGFFHPILKNKSVLFSEDSSQVNIVIAFQLNEPTYISDFQIEKISEADSLILFNYLNYLVDNPLIKTNLENSFNQILEYYENNSFPFAQIKLQSIQFHSDSTEHFATVYLDFIKGSPSIIDSIEVFGNDFTKTSVITREIRFTKGETYSQDKIERIPEVLNRLQFFEPVKEPSFYIDSKDRGILKLEIKEKQTNNFDGIIGYVPAASDEEKGYLTGYINISLRNLFGTGRAAAFNWQKLDRHSEILEIKYLEPWLFGFPFNVQGRLFQRKQDTTYVQRNYSLNIDYLATENLSASLLFESENTIPSNSITNSTILKSNAYTTGFNVRYDSRDNIYAPQKGVHLSGSFKYSNKTIEVDEFEEAMDVKLNRFEVDAEWFLSIFKKQVVALGGHARQLDGKLIETSDLYRLGGTNSLRGYREDQFRGNKIWWSNLEYRFAMSQLTYAFLFFDTGYYYQNSNSVNGLVSQSQFLTGYGLGLSVETNFGIIAVSYALGKGDSFSEGKIHFGLLNEF